MGAPWLAPWIDSYRDSMDARDGNWQTVLNNVRWSIVPALAGGSGQPIPDADTISVFKGLSTGAILTRAQLVNYPLSARGSELFLATASSNQIRAYSEVIGD